MIQEVDIVEVLVRHQRREGYVLGFLAAVLAALFVVRLIAMVREHYSGRVGGRWRL